MSHPCASTQRCLPLVAQQQQQQQQCSWPTRPAPCPRSFYNIGSPRSLSSSPYPTIDPALPPLTVARLRLDPVFADHGGRLDVRRPRPLRRQEDQEQKQRRQPHQPAVGAAHQLPLQAQSVRRVRPQTRWCPCAAAAAAAATATAAAAAAATAAASRARSSCPAAHSAAAASAATRPAARPAGSSNGGRGGEVASSSPLARR